MKKYKLNYVALILVILSIFLVSSPLFSQETASQEKPQSHASPPSAQCEQSEQLPEQSADPMEIAREAVEEGEMEEAIGIYSSILKENPDNFAAQVRLARTYYFAANNNPEYFYRAIRAYHEVIQKWPDFSLPYLHLGQIAYLLGVKAELEGKVKHAPSLYDSALHWYREYIKKIEKEEAITERDREVIRTHLLEAIVYMRSGERNRALQIISNAVENYREISPSEKWGETPLYDFFLRSAIDYIASKLYDQAFIYLEGAWLVNPNTQIKNLFESVTKAKGIQISLPEPSVKKEEEKITPSSEEKQKEETTELKKKIQKMNTSLSTLPSLEEKIQVLEQKITQMSGEVETLKKKIEELPETSLLEKQIAELEKSQEGEQKKPESLPSISSLEERIDKLEDLWQQQERVSSKESTEKPDSSRILEEKIDNLSQQVQSLTTLEEDISKLDQKIQKFSHFRERIDTLEEQINNVDKKVENIKSIADSLKLFKIQLQELSEVVDEMNRRMTQLEQNLIEGEDKKEE